MDLILLTTEQILNQRRVYSTTDRRPLGVPTLVQGTTPAFRLYLIDATGGYTADSGSATKAVRAAVATPGMSAPLVTLDPADFTAITSGWSFSLPLTADAIAALLADANKITTYLEISTADIVDSVEDLTTREVIYRAPVTILPALYDPAATYYTYADLVQAVLDAQTYATSATSSAAQANVYRQNAATSATAAAAAQAAAELAKTAAQTAQTAAETAKTAAENAQAAAAISATGAGNSAAAAAASATSAANAKTAAETAQSAAETAKTAAQDAQTAAETAATAAGNSQTAASASAAAASASQSAASASAAAAAASESAAAASAAAAAASETNAAASAASTLAFFAAQFKGSIAGASVPATSTAAGDWYIISSAGTSQSKTWAADDRAYYNGTSGSWSQVTGQLNWEARILKGDTTRAVASSLLFDGATAGARCQCALGAAGAIGTGDFMLIFEGVAIPSSNPTANKGLGGLGAAGTAITTAGDLNAYLPSGTANLAVELVGSKVGTITGLRTAYNGMTVPIAVRRSSGVVTIWCAGVSQTFSETGAGSWADAISSAYQVLGIRAATELWAGRIGRSVLVNAAFTDAEILTHAQTGQLPDWCAGTGSAVALVAPGTLNGGFETTGGGGGTSAFANSWGGAAITTAAETTDPYAGTNSLRLTGAGSPVVTSNNHYAMGVTTNAAWSGLILGHKYHVEFYAKNVSGGSLYFAINQSAILLTVTAAEASAWTKFSLEFLCTSRYFARPTFAADTSAVWLVDNVTITTLGPIGRHVIQPGCWVMPDDGDNRLPLLLTSGVKAIGTGLNEIAVPGTAMTADGYIHANQIITPNGYELDGFSVKQTGTATSNITVKETGSGGTTVATATLSATVTRVKGTVVTPFQADNKVFWLGNSAWGGNTITPYFTFRRSLAA